jgi:HlyD family secretion protein
MKKIIITVIVVILIGGGLWIFYKNKNGGVQYKTVPIQTGSLRATVTATGTVNAVKTVSVGTQVSGTLKALHVDFNSRVRKGQIIAEIDPAGLQAQVDQARANMLVAKSNVEKARATLEDAKRIRDRNQQLFSKNLIARADLDTSGSTYESNNAQVNAAIAQVAQTEASLRLAETNLGYTKIISPVDGIVVSRSVDVGQTVAASFQTPTLFSIAQDLTKMQIETSIDEADIGKIETGQDVEFTVDAYPDNTFHGAVDEVRIAPVTVSNVVTYIVIVKVDNGDLKLKPGMTANVSIIVASRDRVLKLPNAALRFKPSGKDAPALQAATINKTGGGASGSSDRTASRPLGLEKNNGQSSSLAGKEGMRPSGSSDKAGKGFSDSDRPHRRPPQQEGKEEVVTQSRASDKTGNSFSDSDRPHRRLPPQEGKEGVRPSGLSNKADVGLAGSEKNNGQSSSRIGKGTTQSAPRQYAIWMLENDKLKRVMVTVGISDGSFTEVTSGDVAEGQAVITELSTNGAKKSTNQRPSGPPGGLFR